MLFRSKAATTPVSQPSSPANQNAGNAAPFEQVIKGAERQDGLIPVWRKQDKVWLELSPSMLGKPLFMSPKIASGIGEAGLFGGLMQSRSASVGRPQWVEFRKSFQLVQLVAVNSQYTAQQGTPTARAVEAAFSSSLLASTAVASAPHTKTGAVLVEANGLLMGDILGLSPQLQRAYRQSYALDARNTTIQKASSDENALVLEVNQHFATGSVSQAAPVSGGIGGLLLGASPTVPSSVPDPRSFFIQVHYSFTPLPSQQLPRRVSDARVGFFTSSVVDFTNDLVRNPRQRFINRWRLEKKDPKAALSAPIKPIVFWLDPSIPEGYRATIAECVLEWNKAFEAIGFQDAIEVKQAPADNKFDTLETGHASIRWMTNSQPMFGAIGPSHVDPRSGEILDADIALESLSSRAIRAAKVQYFSHSPESCEQPEYGAEQLGLGLDILTHGGPIDPDSPEVRAFVLAYLKDTTMHEVGHALGLRHNFKASRWHTAEELAHPLLGKEQGNSASVMDYAPINLPQPGQPMAAPFQTTLGPYDYWAIEYGYKPLSEDSQVAQAELQQIAARSSDPKWQDKLAYGTDEIGRAHV